MILRAPVALHIGSISPQSCKVPSCVPLSLPCTEIRHLKEFSDDPATLFEEDQNTSDPPPLRSIDAVCIKVVNDYKYTDNNLQFTKNKMPSTRG